MLGFFSNLSYLCHAAGYRAPGFEVRIGMGGDDSGKRRFSGAGGTPKDYRAERTSLDRRTDVGILAQQVPLSHKFFERFRPKPRWERGIRPWLGRSLLEEAHMPQFTRARYLYLV